MGGGIKKSIRYYHIKVCHNLNEIPLHTAADPVSADLGAQLSRSAETPMN